MQFSPKGIAILIGAMNPQVSQSVHYALGKSVKKCLSLLEAISVK
jgi:hypothetical protein